MTIILVRRPTFDDIARIVEISSEKRMQYEEANARFWRQSQQADILEETFFRSLFSKSGYIFLVAERQGDISGFIIGKKVYSRGICDPGGITILVNDFCVASSDEWLDTGKKLLEALMQSAKLDNAVHIIITSGNHDEDKNNFLLQQELEPTLQWFTCPIER